MSDLRPEEHDPATLASVAGSDEEAKQGLDRAAPNLDENASIPASSVADANEKSDRAKVEDD